MTRDDYIRLHKQTVEAIELVEKHGEANCFIECSNDMFGEKWLAVRRPDWCERYYRARLKPQPKLVPWSSLDEVPLRHWFRQIRCCRLFRIESIDANHDEFPLIIDDNLVSFSDLYEKLEHAAPCDKHSDLIWLPCGKEVVE